MPGLQGDKANQLDLILLGHLDPILPLAFLHGLAPYDAASLELALRLGLPLATLDKELRVAEQTLGVTLL